MLNQLFRSLFQEKDTDQWTKAAQESVLSLGQHLINGLQRSLDGEVSAPVQRPTPSPARGPAQTVRPTASATPHTTAPFKPFVAEDPNLLVKRLVPEVIGLENTAVRGFLKACIKDTDPEWTPERKQRHAAAMEAAILTANPLDVALDLYARMPSRRSLPFGQGELRRLNATFDAIHQMAWRLAGNEIEFSDAQLRKAIAAMGKLIASGLRNSSDKFDYHYWHIVRAAAADQWPKWEMPLVAAFSEAFTGQTSSHNYVVVMVEDLLKHTQLSPAKIPELAAADAVSVKLDDIRTKIAAELGAPLGAAFLYLLDAGISHIDAKNIPELDALRTLEANERGTGFVKFLDVLTGLKRYGLTHWGQLERERGKYRFGIFYEEMPAKFGYLFLQLTRRKIELSDADTSVARLCVLLPKLYYLRDRKILELIFDTMRQNPSGATVAQMREFLNAKPESHPFNESKVEIADVLATLLTGQALHSGGQLGNSQSPQPLSTLEGLPMLNLPNLNFTMYGCWDTLGEHFDNVLDARLYNEHHRDLLNNLAQVREALQAHRVRGGPESPRAELQIVSENGFKGADFVDSFLDSTIDVGLQIRNRLNAFAPFIAQFPEQSRKLSRLVEMLGTKSAPTRKWLDEGHEALGGVPPEVLVDMLESLAGNMVFCGLDSSGDAALRSLIYLSSRFDSGLVGSRLVKVAISDCYAKQSGHGVTPGMKNEKAGNACVWALSEMREGAGIPYLARIQSRVNYPKVKSFIDKRLDAAAENAGMSRGQLDEVTVPTHGFDQNSSLIQAVADGKAVVHIQGVEVATDWIDSNGKTLKSPSIAMKADAQALKTIRNLTKEIKADLSVQVDRLQRIYLEKRSWPIEVWHQHYCAHPLVGPLARRLIWSLDSADGSSQTVLPSGDGKLLHSATGEEVAVSANAKVRLWHPIESPVNDIEAWRSRLEDLQLEQPFAQAWREVYILTDAERATSTYSNRWAAHILRQHQTMELARANGWKVTHRLGYDVSNDEAWHKMIAAYGLVADYWVEGCGGEHAEYSPGGAFSYISTDRVQFHKVDPKAKDSARGPQRGDAVALVDIPPIVFSEVMRHGDLFTSVASIGNDPTWLDDGAEAGHPNSWRRQANQYWRSANTTELEASAKRRRAILERTIPRLKISAQLSLDDRYLHVRGTRHQYRIHLGAGGAFAGERHICIVPKSEPATGKVWLPFEGDRTLSIILSKALLLAQDDKITDPVILAQL